MNNPLLLALTLSGTLFSGAALAQDTPAPSTSAQSTAAHNNQATHGQAAPAHGSLTEQQVREQLTAQGYTNINDVEFDDGLWQADARSADGNRMEVRLHPASGKIYPDNAVATLSEADVSARLTAGGYTNVRDVEFDDGLWTADARDADGREVDLKIDPETGEVIAEKLD